MANTYSLVTTNITDTAVDIKVVSTTGPSTAAASLTVAIHKAGETGGTTRSLSDPGTNSGQLVGTASFASLTPSTQYIVTLTGSPNVVTTTKNFTTKIDRNTPRSATQEQWEDISSKVKAKADNSAFTGTDGVNAGTAGLVPAPATTDAGKFLKADGTWDTAGGGSGPTVVQTTGTSQADVMSQKAVTDELYPQYSDYAKGVIGIGDYTSIANYGITKIGIGHVTLGNSSAYAVAINGGELGGTVNAISALGIWAGSGGTVTGHSGIAIGNGASVSASGGVAIGANSSAALQGEFNIGTSNTSRGYNNTYYRLITGVHDGAGNHDAATYGQLNGRIKQNAGAPTTSLVGTVGQLLEDTTNGKLYQCTGIDYTDPQNPAYTWVEVGGGGSTITMTSTDPGEGSPLAANNFVGVYGGDPIIMDYSINEVNTGAKWIDGSAIYKKTVSLGNLPNNTEVSIAHGISNIGVVVKIEGAAKSSTTNNQIPLPFVSTTLANQIYITTTPTDITVGCSSDRSTLVGYVTLYYTKSS